MDKKSINKRKAEFMKSIMSNKKLSGSFRDAMSSPIGSTKRDQARSTFSIMKKIGGLNDGRGGPFPMPQAPVSPTPTASARSATVIFLVEPSAL